MRVLLDTSFLYGLMAAYGEFSESIRGFAAEHDAEFFVSAVSIWEMRLKYHAFLKLLTQDRQLSGHPLAVTAHKV